MLVYDRQALAHLAHMRLIHSLRGKWLRLLRAFGYAGDAKFFGVRFPIRLAPSATVVADLDAQRYERAETLLVRRYLPAGATVLELGGSLGVISSVILSRSPRRLVSYEAVPDFAAVAREVVGLNHPHAGYTLVNEAIGPIGLSEISFYWATQCSLAGSAGTAGTEGLKLLRVPAVDLSTAISRHAIERGAWLVADIEGMEFELLLNQSNAFAHFDGVIVECHSGEQAGRHRDQREVEGLLSGLGFHLLKRIGPVICMSR